MEYIVHHRFKGTAATGERMNIPYGSRFETIGDFIATPDAKGICFTTSEVAKQHFARNDDGKGLERGKLTWAIAYSPRVRHSADGHQQRFTDDEIELLERWWSRYLRDDVDTILFNQAFFDADPADLRPIAKALKLKV